MRFRIITIFCILAKRKRTLQGCIREKSALVLRVEYGDENLRFIHTKSKRINDREVTCILKQNMHHGASRKADCSKCELLKVCSKYLEQEV